MANPKDIAPTYSLLASEGGDYYTGQILVLTCGKIVGLQQSIKSGGKSHMPELPEVETIKNELRKRVVGKKIVKVQILDDRLVRYSAVSDFEAGLDEQRFEDVDRRAKYLLFHLSSGSFLVLHLMLSGEILLVEPKEPLKKHTRLILSLDDEQQLRLVDSRGFARAYLVTKEQLDAVLHFDKLGPEPLSKLFTPQLLSKILDDRGTLLKPLLIDQHLIAGVGNIYASEILYAARLNPERPANSLSHEEIQHLYQAICSVLNAAIAAHGTSSRYYRDLYGKKGHYEEELKVYGRADKPCLDCSGKVVRVKMDGRSTYFCPSCQPLPRAKAA